MKLVMDKTRMWIVPETVQDTIYIETVLHLTKEGDIAICTRREGRYYMNTRIKLEITPK